jgi:hypothetical protein
MPQERASRPEFGINKIIYAKCLLLLLSFELNPGISGSKACVFPPTAE